MVDQSPKFIRVNGIKSYVSLIKLAGSLIVSGMPHELAYRTAKKIIEKVPNGGMSEDRFFEFVVGSLSGDIRERYVTFRLVKRFLVSKKSRSPLFIFLSGVAGKTLMCNEIVHHLSINQAIAIDNEKYSIIDPAKNQSYLLKATYESPKGYTKTVDALLPRLLYMIERNLFDYGRYKKWCYLWEGIYLSPKSVKELLSRFPMIYYLSLFILPNTKDVKRQYLLRWQNELGVEHLKKRKNIIDRYLKNIEAIRGHLAKDVDPIASFVITDAYLEGKLESFYACFHAKLKDIADKEIPRWVEKVNEQPKLFAQYKTMLSNFSG